MVDFYSLPGTPSDLMTTDKDGTRRMKIETDSSAFYEGREFRAFKEFDIASGDSETIKVVSTVNTIVRSFGASLVLGSLRAELVIGGTEGDDFTGTLPVFAANTMTDALSYTSGVTFENSGTHTGGTIVDLILLFAGSPATQANEVTAIDNLPIGFAPGTFYIRFVSTGGSNAKGVFRTRWEER